MISGQGISLVKRELEPAHFIFQINSYSQLFKEFNDRYESGIFEAGGYKWRLIFYPNGNKKRNGDGHISLYLAIDDSNCHSDNNWSISVNTKFFVHDQNEHQYLAIEEADGVVREFNRLKKEWGIDRLLNIDAFMGPHNGFLVNDSCAFGVEVLVIERKDSIETLSTLSFKPGECTLNWKIENFSKLAYGGTICPEKSYEVAERNWKIKIFPMGNGSEMGRSLAVYLILDGDERFQPKRKMYAKFKLRVMNRHQNKHAEKQLCHWYSTEQSERGSNECVPLVDLYDEESGFLIRKALIVEVEFLLVSMSD